MPAKDKYHDAVVQSLKKSGWTIVSEQYGVVVPERQMWIDIEAQKEIEITILVEVKGFENMLSPIEYLASAIGKYMLYRTALELSKINTPLYLAVPETAFYGILSERIGQALIRKADVKLIVFDPYKQEIVRWIT